MKSILILILITSFLFSDELLTYKKSNKTYSFCIKDYYIKSNKLYYLSSDYPYYYNNVSLIKVKDYNLKSGYIYENNKCKINTKNINNYTTNTVSNLNYTNLTELGLSLEDFNLLMSLSGLFISFLFLFGLFRWI